MDVGVGDVGFVDRGGRAFVRRRRTLSGDGDVSGRRLLLHNHGLSGCGAAGHRSLPRAHYHNFLFNHGRRFSASAAKNEDRNQQEQCRCRDQQPLVLIPEFGEVAFGWCWGRRDVLVSLLGGRRVDARGIRRNRRLLGLSFFDFGGSDDGCIHQGIFLGVNLGVLLDGGFRLNHVFLGVLRLEVILQILIGVFVLRLLFLNLRFLHLDFLNLVLLSGRLLLDKVSFLLLVLKLRVLRSLILGKAPLARLPLARLDHAIRREIDVGLGVLGRRNYRRRVASRDEIMVADLGLPSFRGGRGDAGQDGDVLVDPAALGGLLRLKLQVLEVELVLVGAIRHSVDVETELGVVLEADALVHLDRDFSEFVFLNPNEDVDEQLVLDSIEKIFA